MTENKSLIAQNEEKVIKFWEDNKIFEKSVTKDAPKGDYVFYDGPPFITGLPHYATLLPSIAKDMVPRYWTMKGYRVERVWGWDCHGLPAENKVEQQLNLKNKKDIEKLGIDKFIDACRTYVSTVSSQWDWYIKKIGRWVDMENAYRTMDLNYMESVMWGFKELFNKGLIYEGFRASLHCPRCATPLSKFEVTMDAGSYQDVTEPSIVIGFKLKAGQKLLNKKIEDDLYVLSWTTTPWTLPGNLALAVGKKIEYVKIKVDNIYYIVAKARLNLIEKIFPQFEVAEIFLGEDLVGLEYDSLFDLGNKEIAKNKNIYKIYSADFVTTEDGTGVVHIAPNFGEEDFELGQQTGLPILDLMDENGVYTEEAGEWAGQYFKKAGQQVLDSLKDKLIYKFDYTHSYPFCYRCGTPLIYKTQKAWYLRISELRGKLLKNNQQINWVPEFFKEGRFQNNLESAPDWCLSRSRYWGSPIPIWKCDKCADLKVTGSIKELEDLSGQKVTELHRPDIDQIDIPCKCGGTMKRVPEVLDCWFESGSMPYAQFHYPFERKKEFKNLLPADFIIEYTGQLRGWFYYLHVLANALFKSIAFKNVIVTGVLAGTDGKKMSKSLGNYPDPKKVLDQFGSDALRIYFMSSPLMLGDDMSLSEKDLQTVMRKNIALLDNVFTFYQLFASHSDCQYVQSDNFLDKWIVARLHQLLKEVTENLEHYNLAKATRPIADFIDDLSVWYIRRSRDRFKGSDQRDKELAIKTTSYVLMQLAKTMAPVAPFISEIIWQKLSGHDFKDANASIHLEKWPEFSVELIDNQLIEQMEIVRKIIEQALSVRAEAGIKVRQPLSKLYITKKSLREELFGLIKDEVNVKEIIISDKLPIGDNLKIGADDNYKVCLDTSIGEDLKLEGHARELIRQINSKRKDLGLSLSDLVVIKYQTDSLELKKAIKKFEQDIKNSTLTKELTEAEADNELNINGQLISITIEK
jgi:isoleucyl-tRNA synthetase